MSTFTRDVYHPLNGSRESIWEGFSWPCFFFGCFWYLSKGLWGWAIISFVTSIGTGGLAWLVFPFFANGQYASALIKRGYLNEQQWKDKQQPISRATTPPPTQQETSSVADELTKLVILKDKGVLSDEEFERQKQKILS